MMPWQRKEIMLCGCLAATLLSACAKQEEISRYAVPRLSLSAKKEAEEIPAAAQTFSERDRMLAAIVPRGRKTWFFKLVGPEPRVTEEQAQFDKFTRSLRFTADPEQPEWSLPEGWRRLPAIGQRFATLQVGAAERGLELTVIPLVSPPGNFDDYVLANINRWREQLALPRFESLGSMRAAPPSGWLTEVRLKDDTVATVVNLVGRGQAATRQGPSTSLGLPPSHPPVGSALTGLPQGHPRSNPRINYDAPAGWSPGKVDGMRAAAFEVTDGGRKVEITAISLPSTGGDRLANINRWRQQLDLAPTTPDELAKALGAIEIDHRKGEFIEIVGPDGGKGREIILGTLVDVGAESWFFKLKGDADLAKREKARFVTFVQSVKFPQ
jgi:hypothetical protein